MTRIYHAAKTGRGAYTKMYGRGRAIHHIKRGGSTELLLSPGMGASEGSTNGNGLPSMKKIEETKPQMNNVIKKLEHMHLHTGVKKRNINFKF